MLGRVISATEARVRFGELMRQVTEKGQPVIVEREGKPQVVVLSVAEYDRLRRAAEGQTGSDSPLEQAIAVGARIAERRADRPLTPAVDLLHEIREERDAHHPDLR